MTQLFNQPEDTKQGIKLRNSETGQEILVAVYDKFPQMGDVHIEGRRYVEVSVEMFLTLLATQGFTTVDPNEVTNNDDDFTEDEV